MINEYTKSFAAAVKPLVENIHEEAESEFAQSEMDKTIEIEMLPPTPLK